MTVCQVRLALSVLIRASWDGEPISPGKLERLAAHLRYHQANIKDANASHAKRRKERLRQRGVALDQIRSCLRE